MEFLKDVLSSMLSLVVQGSPWALAIISVIGAVTELGIPTLFAIDTVVLFASFQVGLLSSELFLVILALLFGRLLGSSMIYWASRFLGQRFLKWLEKYQPKISAQINSVAGKLANRATLSITFARLTPGLLTAVSVGSGLVKIRFRYFLEGVALSSIIADFSLVLIGVLAKTGTSAFGIELETWQAGIAAFVFLVVGWGTYFLVQWRKSKKRQPEKAESCPLPQDPLLNPPKR
jgi:membrane protein DedA with SNARE-associated domain